MSYLIANIPQFKCWVRKEFTHNHDKYEGEYLHALAIAVCAIPDRCLSFQVVFTGFDEEDPNPHGGAMWARMPITALIADIPYEEWPDKCQTHIAQPWDCPSRDIAVTRLDRVSSSPWIAKLAEKFYKAVYYFTVDFTGNSIADDPAQHKQSHILELTEGPWKGQIIALPNNRVRVTNPALWLVGEGAPDFVPSQYLHSAEKHDSYTDWKTTFDNLYADEHSEKKE